MPPLSLFHHSTHTAPRGQHMARTKAQGVDVATKAAAKARVAVGRPGAALKASHHGETAQGTSKAGEALVFAQEKAKQSTNWIDLHNALFGIGGKLGELFPTQSERAQFVKTPEHKQIMDLLQELQQQGSLPEQLATANGTIIVRAPKSVHAALLAEAEAEGVSLNQLCVSKLSAQLRAVVQ